MYKLNQIPSEAQIKKFIRRTVFGKNIYCPECKSRKVIKYQERYHCLNCKSRFSLISHTWLKNMKVSYQEFWLILWCWTNQIPVKQSICLTKFSEVSVRHWFELFRSKLPVNQEILNNLVQLDEAYFKNRSLLLGKEIGSKKLAFRVLDTINVQRQHATDFLQDYIGPETNLNTDGAKIYRNIDQWWPVTHHYDIHRKWEFSQTSEIEGMFGCLRTFIRRMYHHVSSDKLPSLVSEFCFRFSSPELFINPQSYLEKTLRLVTSG